MTMLFTTVDGTSTHHRLPICITEHLFLRPLAIYSSCGGDVGKKDSQEAPTVKFNVFEQGIFDEKFVLLMADPDASSKPNMYWLHWLKTDIGGQELLEGVTESNSDMVAYQGPNPPEGIHRYQFFLYTQNTEYIKVSNDIARGKRLINLKKFEEVNNLDVISNYQYLVSAI
ncbi:uncharacterized protein LOC115215108 [Argonauta hians]